jgi:hypothetical protein
MKGFIHGLLEVGKADFDESSHRSIFALKSRKAQTDADSSEKFPANSYSADNA